MAQPMRACWPEHSAWQGWGLLWPPSPDRRHWLHHRL